LAMGLFLGGGPWAASVRLSRYRFLVAIPTVRRGLVLLSLVPGSPSSRLKSTFPFFPIPPPSGFPTAIPRCQARSDGQGFSNVPSIVFADVHHAACLGCWGMRPRRPPYPRSYLRFSLRFLPPILCPSKSPALLSNKNAFAGPNLHTPIVAYFFSFHLVATVPCRNLGGGALCNGALKLRPAEMECLKAMALVGTAGPVRLRRPPHPPGFFAPVANVFLSSAGWSGAGRAPLQPRRAHAIDICQLAQGRRSSLQIMRGPTMTTRFLRFSAKTSGGPTRNEYKPEPTQLPLKHVPRDGINLR